MSKFKKNKKKDAPGITTASLPDIVFMLLCFFMVVTKMRDADVKVRVRIPQATELQKLEKKSMVSHIFIGPPSPVYQAQFGSAPKIQLNDAFAKPEDIMQFVNVERSAINPERHNEMTCAMKIDGEVKMGLITDVKTELRKANFRRVSYLANKRAQ
ncbi:biopolymer transport protein [Saprospira grandis DSM 2844]|uniref:Biopolymer transport protein n=1 Tax=Saprospira grandis DSM 2844 TaxID=694433 RepID=J0XU74_9BACT|nr:biopolymer transporter ExbD [Saprospira grandis]EJF52526.1 biopolymer transport protein [Saprospira grandis DSM 2844]